MCISIFFHSNVFILYTSILLLFLISIHLSVYLSIHLYFKFSYLFCTFQVFICVSNIQQLTLHTLCSLTIRDRQIDRLIDRQIYRQIDPRSYLLKLVQKLICSDMHLYTPDSSRRISHMLKYSSLKIDIFRQNTPWHSGTIQGKTPFRIEIYKFFKLFVSRSL